jgi:hypothetical protein
VNRLARALASAAAGLTRHPFALVGGIAVSARVEPRFTRDLDIAVAVADDAGAEAVVREMIGRQFRLTTLIEQSATDRLATVRLAAPDETDPGIVVDLLFASSGIEREIASRADPLEVFAGVTAPVAQSGHLIALKLLARDDLTRPQDAVDLRALIAAATDDDLALATDSVRLIAARGFNRDRDLTAALAEAVRDFRR